MELGAKVGAQAERSRVLIAKYQADISAKGLEWDGWKTKLQAEVAKMDSAVKQSALLYDGYKIASTATDTRAAALMRRWEADIRQYEAGQHLVMEAGKANAQATMHAYDAKLEAAKVALATSSQNAASAWSMVSASAQVGSNMSYSYQM